MNFDDLPDPAEVRQHAERLLQKPEWAVSVPNSGAVPSRTPDSDSQTRCDRNGRQFEVEVRPQRAGTKRRDTLTSK